MTAKLDKAGRKRDERGRFTFAGAITFPSPEPGRGARHMAHQADVGHPVTAKPTPGERVKVEAMKSARQLFGPLEIKP